ncbi:hypothetical protein AAVH_09153 [Aphelenchoides avenae]|nr:hypothetical protein AAVH_09153 [Aphelenchus avenae]
MRDSKYEAFYRNDAQDERAECLACGTDIKCTQRNTSGKMRHLQRMHPYLYKIAMEADEEFTVERILAVVIMRQMFLVEVKWLGWPLKDATWEPVRHFKDAPHFVYDYFVNEGLDVPPLVLGALHGL